MSIFLALPSLTSPVPTPSVPATTPLPPITSPVPTGTQIIYNNPDIHMAGTSPWVPIATFGAALLGAAALYLNEIRKSNREDDRKILEFVREDERQWDREIRDLYVEARFQLRILTDAKSDVRQLLREHDDSRTNRIAFDTQFVRVTAAGADMKQIADRLRVIGDKSLIHQFDLASDEASRFKRMFRLRHGEYYPNADSLETLDFGGIETNMLYSVKETLRRPTMMALPNESHRWWRSTKINEKDLERRRLTQDDRGRNP